MKQQSIKLFILSLFWVLASSSFAEGSKWRAPETVEGATTITVEQAKELFDQGAAFIDVRSLRLYARRHVPKAHHLDLESAFTQEALEKVAQTDEPVVIYCSGVKCGRSSSASKMAISWGFKDVRYFRAGIVGWRDAGFPIESAAK